MHSNKYGYNRTLSDVTAISVGSVCIDGYWLIDWRFNQVTPDNANSQYAQVKWTKSDIYKKMGGSSKKFGILNTIRSIMTLCFSLKKRCYQSGPVKSEKRSVYS